MNKIKMLMLPALLSALTLCGCVSNFSLGGDAEESWSMSGDGQEAKAAYDEFLEGVTAFDHARVTYDPWGETFIEEIDGTSDYIQNIYEGELYFKTWVFVEDGQYYAACYDIEEEEKTYVINKDSYDDDYKGFLHYFTEFEIEPNTFSYVDAGHRETKDGVTSGEGEVHFTASIGENYFKADIKTDGTWMTEATVERYNDEDKSTTTFHFAFDYKASFTFEKPDLSEFSLSELQ